jgi:hypothetical protein
MAGGGRVGGKVTSVVQLARMVKLARPVVVMVGAVQRHESSSLWRSVLWLYTVAAFEVSPFNQQLLRA